ncbi:MAG TPA: hypothetical protein VGR78_18225, partial [Verrucomicrobiae bacterium]|nr:hypothetical protein [Verrucomicrobiae bacterium]
MSARTPLGAVNVLTRTNGLWEVRRLEAGDLKQTSSVSIGTLSTPPLDFISLPSGKVRFVCLGSACDGISANAKRYSGQCRARERDRTTD